MFKELMYASIAEQPWCENASSAESKLISELSITSILQARQLLEQEYNSLISMGTERRPDEVSMLICL